MSTVADMAVREMVMTAQTVSLLGGLSEEQLWTVARAFDDAQRETFFGLYKAAKKIVEESAPADAAVRDMAMSAQVAFFLKSLSKEQVWTVANALDDAQGATFFGLYKATIKIVVEWDADPDVMLRTVRACLPSITKQYFDDADADGAEAFLRRMFGNMTVETLSRIADTATDEQRASLFKLYETHKTLPNKPGGEAVSQ